MFVKLVATEAVIVDAFSPNEIPFEFENVTADKLLLVVPALTLMFVRLVATEAVIVDAFRPNEIPFEFENVMADKLLLVVPALKLTLPCDDAALAEAVT